MTAQMIARSPQTARVIGELCFAGDRACAQSDLGALAEIADRLAAFAPEPLHCELEDLAEICRADRIDATAVWTQLKDRIYCEPSRG